MTLIIALLSALSWICFDVCRKQLAPVNTALNLSVLFGIGVLPIYAALWLWHNQPMPQFGYWLPGTISGVLAAIGAVSFAKGLAVGRLSMLMPVVAITPVISAIAGFTLLGESLSYLQLACILLTTLALFCLYGGKLKVTEPGVGFVAITACCWGLCIVFDKMALHHAGTAFHAMWISVCIVVLLSSVALVSKQRLLCNGNKWIWLAALCAFTLAVLAQLTAVQHIQPGVFEALKRGVGVIGALAVGHWLFKEDINTQQVIWIIVILSATIGLSMQVQRF